MRNADATPVCARFSSRTGAKSTMKSITAPTGRRRISRAAADIILQPCALKPLGIIPARWGSTRFPGQAAALDRGQALLQHVWERCVRAKRLDAVIVATDDMRIAEAAFAWGAEVALTSPTSQRHRSRGGSGGEGAQSSRHFINIQGDEPLIDPKLLDRHRCRVRDAIACSR